MGKDKPRLGRGLSGLLSRPVEVAVPPQKDGPTPVVATTNVGVKSGGGDDLRAGDVRGDLVGARGVRAGDRSRDGGDGEHARGGENGDGVRVVGDGARGEGARGEKSGGGVDVEFAEDDGVDVPRLRMVRVGDVVVNRYQPRREMDVEGLSQLAASVRVSGVMQPLLVRAMDGKWELVAGERRWRAAMMVGLEFVPAVVTKLSDQEAAEWAVVENLQREDLNPMDRALALSRLIELFGLSHVDLAARLGIDRTSVANHLRLLELDDGVRSMVSKGTLSMGHAKALLMLPPAMGAGARTLMADRAAREGWSVRETEVRAGEAKRRWASEAIAGARGAVAEVAGPSAKAGAVRAALERQLGEHLGTKVEVRSDAKGKKGKVVISFYSTEHFEGLMGKMGFHMES